MNAPGAPRGPVVATDVLGRRIAAALLDALLLAAVFVAVGIASGGAHASDGSATVNVGGGGSLVWLMIVLVYYFASEAATGQTLGKRALGVRVVSSVGGQAAAGAVLVRTLLRVVDSLPFLYLVGLVAVLATGPRRQRIGDLAAATSVVRA